MVLGAYALAREIGAPRRVSVLTGLLVGFIPAVATCLTTAYVDVIVLEAFLLGTLFVGRAVRRPRGGDVLASVAALSVGAGVKIILLPMALLGFTLASRALLRTDGRRRGRALVLAGCVLLGAVAFPPYLRAWRERGSPVYPFALEVAGRELHPGNRQAVAIHSGRSFGSPPFAPADFLLELFVPRSLLSWREHLNLGPAPILLAVPTIVGFAMALRNLRGRATLQFLLAGSVLVFLQAFSEQSRALRTVWVHLIGRFLAPVAATGIVLAALPAGRWASALRRAAAAISMALAVPGLGWSQGEATAVAATMATGAAAVATGRLALFSPHTGRRRRYGIWAAGFLAVLGLVGWSALRRVARYPIYAAVAEGRSYDWVPLERIWTQWRAWAFLDDPRAPHRIAAASGWDGIGQKWYRYPLLGSRLQNEVLYVPVTREGDVIDYEGLDERRCDYTAWLGRLLEHRIDYVVVSSVPTIEERWMRAHPERFQLIEESECVYRLVWGRHGRSWEARSPR